MDDLFAPAGLRWSGVSRRLAVVRRGLLGLALVPLAAAVVLLLVLDAGAGWVVVTVVAGIVGLAWGWWLIGRNQQRWRYAEGDEELYVTRGAMFRRITVVPYGRMQYVDVRSGPLDQLAGIAELQVHTASPATSATLPGLPLDEATRLRDRLTVSGESATAGL